MSIGISKETLGIEADHTDIGAIAAKFDGFQAGFIVPTATVQPGIAPELNA